MVQVVESDTSRPKPIVNRAQQHKDRRQQHCSARPVSSFVPHFPRFRGKSQGSMAGVSETHSHINMAWPFIWYIQLCHNGIDGMERTLIDVFVELRSERSKDGAMFVTLAPGIATRNKEGGSISTKLGGSLCAIYSSAQRCRGPALGMFFRRHFSPVNTSQGFSPGLPFLLRGQLH